MGLIQCEIEGITPLLMNRFPMLGNDSKKTVEQTPEEVCEAKVYYGMDGKTIVIPQPNILACIVDGGKFFKVGVKKVTTRKDSLVTAAISLNEIEYPLKTGSGKPPWSVDARPVVNPFTNGRQICYRPCFYEWGLKFEIDHDPSIFGKAKLREIVDMAGKACGLGDFRPGRKGPFGKFQVVLWK